MKNNGVYYMLLADKIIVISNLEHYEDLFNINFSLVTWEWSKGKKHKVAIREDQFNQFIYLGVL